MENLQHFTVRFLERSSNSRGVEEALQGGFFLRKKPLWSSGFPLHQLENRYNCTEGGYMFVSDTVTSHFDRSIFFANAVLGRRAIELKPKQTFFNQGDPADSVFYLQ
jgi:hypothetical protein